MAIRHLGSAGQLYFATVVVAGGCTIAWAVFDLWTHPTIDSGWILLAALTLASGSASLRLPTLPAVLSVSETFLFTAALLYGPAAATITVVIDALAIGFWTTLRGNPLHKAVFTLCANSVAMWSGASLFFALSGVAPLVSWADPETTLSGLLVPLFAFVVVDFSLSSWLIAFAISFERRGSAFDIWLKNFAWLSLNFFAGASVAVLFFYYTPLRDPRYLLVVLPLVAVVYLAFVTSMGRIADANKHLADLNRLYLSTIETLATAIDAKDQVTHGHIRRVQQFAVALARALGINQDIQLRAIEAASLLHDMGKLAVPDYILNKPGPLTAAEFERMKMHASVGADILSAIDFPYPVVPIVRHHHESWNGAGYPDGLAGEDIPIGARVLAVVDCYDALTSDRPYRPRLTDEAAMAIIRERSGTMYDPVVVAEFENVRERVLVEGSATPPREGSLAAIIEAAAAAHEGPAQTRLHEISASSEEMLALYEIARAVSGPFSFDDAAEIVARHLRRLIPSTFCVFYSYEADTDDLLAAHASGDTARLFTGLRIAMGQRLTGWVGANRQTILNSDPVLDLGEAARMARPPLKSALSTPLVSDDTLVGVLTLYASTKVAFTEDHGRIVEAVARQISTTLRNALHYEERKKSSLRDELTGLPSIERLRTITEAIEGSAGSGAGEGSIILLDVDKLHHINQRFGRVAGDEVLARVAAVIRRCLEGDELLFRNTGDEFVIYVAGADRTQAERRAWLVRRAISESQIANPLGMDPVCVSVSTASVPGDGTSIDKVLATAQRRLTAPPGPSSTAPPGSVH